MLGAHVRSGTEEHDEADVARHAQERGDVSLAGKVVHARLWLVLVPEYVDLDGVEAGRPHLGEPIVPQLVRHAVRMDAARHVAEGRTVAHKRVIGKVDVERAIGRGRALFERQKNNIILMSERSEKDTDFHL